MEPSNTTSAAAHFAEREQSISLLRSLAAPDPEESTASAFEKIIERYQEQPELLDTVRICPSAVHAICSSWPWS